MAAIKKVAVLGAGVMGSGIAAHIANAGIEVRLLDIVPEGANDRNQLARTAIEKLQKQKPAAFMHRRFAKRVTAGNLQDNMAELADCDWICEAVLENPAVKREVYTALEAVRKDGSIVTSNTSTIPLQDLTQGMPERFRRDFAITHFFNPPRYMRLLEIVGGSDTRPEILHSLQQFGDQVLGKQVVVCKDTPGFIANRIGIYWSSVAMAEAMARGLTVEEADSIVGRPMGIPKTGIFGLMDLTGIDLAPHINQSMLASLPADDAFVQEYDAESPLAKLIENLIATGRIGRKSGAGFYKRETVDGKFQKLALDLESGDYRPTRKARLQSAKAARKGLRALVGHEDKGGQYAWAVLSKTLSYAASLVPEIADDVVSVDAAMKTGYAWKYGPFEQIDQLGAAWFAEKLQAEGRPVPPIITALGDGRFYQEQDKQIHQFMPAGQYQELAVAADAWRLADKKRGQQPIARNGSASLWDVGDQVACLELHSKMNAIDADTIAMLQKAAAIDKQGYQALIIGGDADNFSVGANVGVVLFAANAAMWPVIEQSISGLQNALLKLKYAAFPVVSAVSGMALGGGCEIALASDAVQAHSESYMGLVEVGVGVIPAGGGTKELLTRCSLNKRRPGGPMPPVAQCFETISLAKVSTSAAEAFDLMFLRQGDGITMNRQRLLADAKAKAISLAADYAPPEPIVLNLPGATAKSAMLMAVDGFIKQGVATPHDAVVATELAHAVAGGDTDITEEVTEKQLLALERAAFMNLVRSEPTLQRIEHMLQTGRPLRN